MRQETIRAEGVEAEGYVIPMGSFNLVFARTARGMLACGAFDVAALERFAYPAARVKGAGGAPVATVEDLLNGEVREANAPARALGVAEGQPGRDALRRLAGDQR